MANYPIPSTGAGGLPFGQAQMNALMGNEDHGTFQEAYGPASGVMTGNVADFTYTGDGITDFHANDFNSTMLPQQFVGNGQQAFAQPMPVYNAAQNHKFHKFHVAWGKFGHSEQDIDKVLSKLSQAEIDGLEIDDPVVSGGVKEDQDALKKDARDFELANYASQPQTGYFQSQADLQVYAQTHVQSQADLQVYAQTHAPMRFSVPSHLDPHAPKGQINYAGYGNHPAHVPGSSYHHRVGPQSENGSDDSASTINTTSPITPPGDNEDDIDSHGVASPGDLGRAQAEFLARPAPDHNDRDARDQYLVDGRACGIKYEDIKQKGLFKEKESTLRGRHRTLTKAPEERVRAPKWRRGDYITLVRLVKKHHTYPTENCSQISWGKIAQEMWEKEGCSYPFCAATVARAARKMADTDHNGRIPSDALP